MKILVELEFDEVNLGQKWMNIDNLELLLYTDNSTKKELLKVTQYTEILSIENNHQFTCPKCEGHWWHTSGLDLKNPHTTGTGHCDSEHYQCNFSWPRTEDEKYFRWIATVR